MIDLTRPGDNARPIVVLLIVVCLLRVLYLLVYGLDLSPDEAYYWNWSQHLDWCYYSKPPMIAWLLAASTSIFGNNELGVRLPAVLFGTASLWLLYQTALTLYGRRAAAIAVLLALATPANALLNLIMTIDVPLLFGWSLALLGLCNATFGKAERGASRWWWLAATGVAFATLAKQMGAVFPILAMLALLVAGEHRKALARGIPCLWLGVLVAAMPVLIWNANHDWIMFQHTAEHIEPKPWTALGTLETVGTFAGSQLLLLNPVFFVIYGLLTWKAFRHFRTLGARERLLCCFGCFPILLFFALSVIQRVHPNWPLVFYLPVMILAAGWLAGEVRFSTPSTTARRWLRPCLITGVSLVVLIYSLPWVLHATGKTDPLHRVVGWERYADAVAEQLDTLELADGTPVIVQAHRSFADALAFYLRDGDEIHRWAQPGVIQSQHELWPGPSQNHAGKPVIVLSPLPLDELPDALITDVGGVRFVGKVTVPVGDTRTREVHCYIGPNLQTWRGKPLQ